jgi:hypothetical protein
MSAKVAKPDKYDGQNKSIAAVKAWAFDVGEYLELTNVDENNKTRMAALFLSGDAKIWYINTYVNVTPLPKFKDFLKAFKEHHLASHSEADVIRRLETIYQGRRAISEYTDDFKLLNLQLDKQSNPAWVTNHYLRGLEDNIRNSLVPTLEGDESLDTLIKKARNVARNVELLKSLERSQGNRYPPRSSTTSTRPSSGRTSSAPVKSTGNATLKFTTKLTDADREYLRNNKGCYKCRKTYVDHVAANCPEKWEYVAKEAKEPETKKESISALNTVAESESDSDYPCSSVPTIKLATTIQNTEFPSSLVDCGATINVISSNEVAKQSIPTLPTHPVRVHEPMNPQGILVDKKIVSKVGIPAEGWESSKPAEFLVAPLQEHDVVLGMPFLASENILIDPGQGKIILPPPDTNESDGYDELYDDDEFDDDEFHDGDYTMRSICPKVSGAQPLTPPECPLIPEELGWIAALNITNSETPFPNPETSNPISSTEASKLNEKYIFEFSDVFTDKLPNTLPNPDAPRHRIILEDEKLSVNGRLFRLPTRYWPRMIEFIEEHRKAGRIRPSSSHIASGTWMIPKKDPNVMPRVVHDYRAVNAKTIKDHTPLTRQDDIIENLAKARVRGKIDLICAYYQILMEEADIHKTAFKTPFGMYEWLVMPQGLCNAVATFQRYMNWVLRKYVGKFCAVYIDDIAIWSNSVEEHEEHVRLILEALREAGICASKDKSILFADEILFLGHIISSRGVEVAQDKVDKILAARTPTSTTMIKEFNGLANYIGQFIPGLSHWTTVLSSLTKKNVKFEWEPIHQEAFDNIKRLAKNTPICKPVNYDSSDTIMLVADASNRGVGGYYGQGNDYKTMVPAGFHSRAFNPAEKNYPTHDK